MKNRAIVVLAIVGLSVLSFNYMYPSATHRYRLTLVADDNGKPVVGSGVIEASYWKQIQILSSAEYGSSARGEAVIVDFGEKGLLFSLLKGDDVHSDADWIVPLAFGIERTSPAEIEVYQLRALTGKTELPLSKLPILVRFRDINDPKTVERVDPNNIAASLGPGVTLVAATIEITGDPVSTGIEKRLAWMPNFYDKHFDGDGVERLNAKNRFANLLSSGNFKSTRN
jgi:hypothetical protein